MVLCFLTLSSCKKFKKKIQQDIPKGIPPLLNHADYPLNETTLLIRPLEVIQNLLVTSGSDPHSFNPDPD
jgi:ABC-type Zn uptake system ZnuABC Zn-binding protein ZnuA